MKDVPDVLKTFWVLVSLRNFATLAGDSVSFVGLWLNVCAKQKWWVRGFGLRVPSAAGCKNQTRMATYLS